MSTRTTSMPPDAALVAAQAAVQGVAVSPERAGAIATDLGRMLAALDDAAKALAFEDEPALFLRALREAAR